MNGYPAWPELFRWLTVLKDRVEQLPSISAEQVITGTLDPSVIPPIPWARVLKAGSSLGDLETRSAADLSSGTLLDARMPALTGDASSTAGTVALTLATVNSSPGTYGSGSKIPLVSVNAKGLVTLITEQPIATGALTRVNDTNVTATLGGTPLTALLKDVSITLGWSGTLAVSRGGTNIASYAVGDILYASGATTLSKLADVAVGSYLRSGGVTTAPLWSTLTLPNAANSGDIFKASGANAMAATAPQALTKTDDTNVTLTLGGSATTALVNAASLTLGWTGLLGLARGGTHADLSATGGAKNYLKQAGVGADITVGTIPASDIGSGAALTGTNDTNVTLTLGGSPSTALLAAASLTLGWTGTLSVTRGGTGTGTAFTAGSVVFAVASGVYAQDNANWFYDVVNHRVGIGTPTPGQPLEIAQNSATGVTPLRVTNLNQTNVTTKYVELEFEGADFSGPGVAKRAGAIRANPLGADWTATKVDFYTRSASADVLALRLNDAGWASITGGVDPLAPVYVKSNFWQAGFPPGIVIESQRSTLALYDFTTPSATASIRSWMNTANSFYLGHGTSAGNYNYAGNVIDLSINTDASDISYIGIAMTTQTARLHLPAGAAAASRAPLKLTSGTVLTTAEAGAIEFLTDDFFATITTGAARKAFILDNGARLTSGKVPVATTNGRLIDGPTLGAAGLKIPAIQADGFFSAQTAAKAIVAQFTLSAADGVVVILSTVNVTASTLHSFSVQVDYTDETNTAQTETLTYTQLNAASVSVITNGTGTGPYNGVALTLRCKASTSVTVKTTGTFTSVSYNVGATIAQFA